MPGEPPQSCANYSFSLCHSLLAHFKPRCACSSYRLLASLPGPRALCRLPSQLSSTLWNSHKKQTLNSISSFLPCLTEQSEQRLFRSCILAARTPPHDENFSPPRRGFLAVTVIDGGGRRVLLSSMARLRDNSLWLPAAASLRGQRGSVPRSAVEEARARRMPYPAETIRFLPPGYLSFTTIYPPLPVRSTCSSGKQATFSCERFHDKLRMVLP